MKGSWLWLLFLLVPSALCHDERNILDKSELNVQGGVEFSPTVATNPQKRDEVGKKPIIVNRCRAQELSPGGALGIMVVLATGNAVHMRGSIVIPNRGGLYRLAPELGIFEAMAVLLMVVKGRFIYRKSLKISVMSTLALRYFKADGDLWWQSEGPSSPANCYEYTKPILDRIRQFGHDRLLGDGLMTLAIIKAFAVKGTTRTNLLAASYALSFFTIELLSLAALHLGPPSTRKDLETEAAECLDLVTRLDNSDNAWEHRTSARWQNQGEDLQRLELSKYVIGTLFGLSSALHLIFWPFSVPMFFLFDFVEHHKGKWIFTYSTFLLWGFWIAVAGTGLFTLATIPRLMPWKFPERRDRYWEFCKGVWRRWFTDSEVYVDAYAILKFALIVRFYLSSYTGKGTTKPTWLDWLG